VLVRAPCKSLYCMLFRLGWWTVVDRLGTACSSTPAPCLALHCMPLHPRPHWLRATTPTMQGVNSGTASALNCDKREEREEL
jgi:hypothetical protein